MTGTGQRPSFEHGLFRTCVADWALSLIPAEEVSLMTLHADVFLGEVVGKVGDVTEAAAEPFEVAHNDGVVGADVAEQFRPVVSRRRGACVFGCG